MSEKYEVDISRRSISDIYFDKERWLQDPDKNKESSKKGIFCLLEQFITIISSYH